MQAEEIKAAGKEGSVWFTLRKPSVTKPWLCPFMWGGVRRPPRASAEPHGAAGCLDNGTRLSIIPFRKGFPSFSSPLQLR